jgi:crotonobetainyl-CoA:carnitine CoA-transferase CaiB-like acyl-CoA transferase
MSTSPACWRDLHALKAGMEVALKKLPAARWLKVIHEAGVPVGQTNAWNMLIKAEG